MKVIRFLIGLTLFAVLGIAGAIVGTLMLVIELFWNGGKYE